MFYCNCCLFYITTYIFLSKSIFSDYIGIHMSYVILVSWPRMSTVCQAQLWDIGYSHVLGTLTKFKMLHLVNVSKSLIN